MKLIKYKLGIIGLGYVGSAVKSYFSKYFDHINTYDLKVDSTSENVRDVVVNSNIIFICLPTPMNKDGSTNLEIINNVLKDCNLISNKESKRIIIKSTIPVGSSKKFQSKYNNLKIFFNPEFLTEENFIEDYNNPNRIIVGGPKDKFLNEFFNKFFPNVNYVHTDYKTAESVKYLANTFLAVKVSFANEFENFCTKFDIDYNKVVRIATMDKRLGDSHWKVPGPDRMRGYGGSCFPKDISSLIHQFETNNITSFILKASWERNCNLDRAEKDWTKLKGRAVTDD